MLKRWRDEEKMKTKLSISSLFFLSLFAFFLIGVAISNADCECTSDSDCVKYSWDRGAFCRDCQCVTNGACDNLDTLATCAIGMPSDTNDAISGTGPWSWWCVGSSNGTPAKCTSGKNNPTQYASLNGNLGHISADKIDKHGNSSIGSVSIHGYLPYFRVFIPPGASYAISGTIFEWNGQNAIVRYKTPPTSTFGNPPGSIGGGLEKLAQADGYAQGIEGRGTLDFLGDGFGAPYLQPADAGWYYVKVDSFKGSASYNTQVNISVNAKTYNDWYDHSGSNPDGSINWAKDVEGVTTYIPKSANIAINGVCGTSNNQAFSSIPTDNLCSTGTASAVTGSGSWNWTCAGSNGGTTASCNATKSSGTVNPTQYVSLNGDLGRISADEIDENGRCYVNIINNRQYFQYYRVFIPPGATIIDVHLNDWNGQSAIARHKTSPISTFGSLPISNKYDLAYLEAADRYFPGYAGTGQVSMLGDNIISPYLSINRAGWFYVKFDSNRWEQDRYTNAIMVQVDAKTYNDWYDHSGSNPDGSINWAKDVEGVEVYSPNDTTCNTKTCVGNSCWNGTQYIAGTKTQNCATGKATANPTIITTPNSSFITWTSSNAKAMEAQCTGPVPISRGGWFTSDTECKTSTLVKECTDKGYELKFTNNQSGQETCTFYPTNTKDNLPGTPFSVTIQVKSVPICGNSIVEGQEECDYNPSLGLTNYVPCPTGKTCENCQCTAENKNSPTPCQPDDPACAKSTCKDVRCFDGCNYQQGSKDCKGRE